MDENKSKAGDVNGDGFDDLAVGSYFYDNAEANEGAVFVWYGGPLPDGLWANGNPGNADWRAETNTAADYFGYAVRSAGDVNKDGIDDLIATAYGFDALGGGGTLDAAANAMTQDPLGGTLREEAGATLRRRGVQEDHERDDPTVQAHGIGTDARVAAGAVEGARWVAERGHGVAGSRPCSCTPASSTSR